MTLDQLFHPLTVIRREMEENPQGFILLPCFTESPVSGYAVAVRETQNSFGLTGLLKALTFALENGLSFGGWYNEANGQFYFDAVRLFAEGELQQATEFGKKMDKLPYMI